MASWKLLSFGFQGFEWKDVSGISRSGVDSRMWMTVCDIRTITAYSYTRTDKINQSQNISLLGFRILLKWGSGGTCP